MTAPARRAAGYMVCAAWLAKPTTAMAMAPNYGIVEAIVIGVGIAIVLVWLLSVLIVAKVGGLFLRRPGSAVWVGLVYAIVTMAAAGIWAGRMYSEAMQAHAESAQRRVVADKAESEACRLRAGEEIFATLPLPPVVYVHVVPASFDPFDGLGWGPDQDPRDARVQYVSKFPDDRPDGAVLVEARPVVEPIPGADGFNILAAYVEVRSANRSLLARRFDVWLNPEWCLSPERPSHAVRHFVKRVVDIDIDPSPGRQPLDAVRTLATTGTLGPIEEGRFAHPDADAASLDYAYPGLTSLLTANSCALKPALDKVVCADNSPSSNSIRRHSLLAGFEVEDGWLGITRVHSGDEHVHMLDAVKRNRAGAITARWRIRFPPVPGHSVDVESASLDGTRLTVDLLLDRSLEDAPAAGGTSPQHRRVSAQRVRLGAELLQESNPAPPWHGSLPGTAVRH